jgi:hypothetical protein
MGGNGRRDGAIEAWESARCCSARRGASGANCFRRGACALVQYDPQDQWSVASSDGKLRVGQRKCCERDCHRSTPRTVRVRVGACERRGLRFDDIEVWAARTERRNSIRAHPTHSAAQGLLWQCVPARDSRERSPGPNEHLCGVGDVSPTGRDGARSASDSLRRCPRRHLLLIRRVHICRSVCSP